MSRNIDSGPATKKSESRFGSYSSLVAALKGSTMSTEEGSRVQATDEMNDEAQPQKVGCGNEKKSGSISPTQQQDEPDSTISHNKKRSSSGPSISVPKPSRKKSHGDSLKQHSQPQGDSVESTPSPQRGRTPPPPTSKTKSQGASLRSSSAPLTSTTTGVRKRSGSIGGGGGGGNGGSQLRRGKWTVEEETYVARVIQDFNSGFLDAPAGTTLRTYLSEKLQCDPMRITKKFTGDACIGKRVFHPAVKSSSNSSAIEKAQAELEDLEHRWRRRMELQQTESAKKAAASAAAVAAATGAQGDATQVCLGTCPQGLCTCAPNLVRAAGWLERAKSSLENNEDLDRLSREEIVQQMEKVKRLLNEGAPPGSPVLPPISTQSSVPPNITVTTTKVAEPARHASFMSSRSPDSKRLKSEEVSSDEAADAAALVNFLQTVQAAAAASQGPL